MLRIRPSVPRCVTMLHKNLLFVVHGPGLSFLFWQLLQVTFPYQWMSWELPSYRPVLSTQQRQVTLGYGHFKASWVLHPHQEESCTHNLLYHWSLYLSFLALYKTGFISHFKQLSCSKAAVWCCTQCSLSAHKVLSGNIKSPGHILHYNNRKMESSLHKELVEFVLVWCFFVCLFVCLFVFVGILVCLN